MSEVLQMVHISKSFPGVKALDQVSMSVKSGEVHALIGENGAGKSTLMKILSGAYQKDSGEIFIDGKPVEIEYPEEATELGISIIYQELNLMPNLSIAENIFMGREKRKGFLLDKHKTYKEATQYINQVGLYVDAETKVQDLSLAQQQMVEVAKALSIHAKVIIMDEPTSSLTERENEILMGIINDLREMGTAIVFISHKLDEVFDISDRITVLRDGQGIGTVDTNQVDEGDLIQMMVGRPLQDLFPKVKVNIGKEVLQARNVYAGDLVQDISFTLHRGEILGFYGLVGAGRSELMSAIFGIDAIDSGEVLLDGVPITNYLPDETIKLGMGFVPEDRRLQGLILGMTIRENITISNLEGVSSRGIINRIKENKMADQYVESLDVRATSIEQRAVNLSGGNQQKVVIAKWLATKPKVLILDEPTRGIDVGAKKEIYHLMEELVREDVGIIMVSSELPEILAMSDRIVVMHEGEVRGVMDQQEATQEGIMSTIVSSRTQNKQ